MLHATRTEASAAVRALPMLFETYHRICVGLPLENDAAHALRARFHAHLGLEPDASTEAVYARLAEDLPRHRQNEPDRARYELALEAFVDKLWDVDCAIGGMSDGGFDPSKGYLFVGVRVEQWARTAHDDQPAAATRPQWLKKGDMSVGSDLSRALGTEAKKALDHASKMFQRARVMIEGDARVRLKTLPVLRQRDPSWALVRWLVPVR